jgi:excisionase family DNA binding protein
MWISPAEAARRLSCSRQHIYDLLRRGVLVGFQECRRHRVQVQSLEAYLARHLSPDHTPTPGPTKRRRTRSQASTRPPVGERLVFRFV